MLQPDGCSPFTASLAVAQFGADSKPFKINTYINVSKQTTLTPPRMNTYAKPGERAVMVIDP
jgi:hypothetical protein